MVAIVTGISAINVYIIYASIMRKRIESISLSGITFAPRRVRLILYVLLERSIIMATVFFIFIISGLVRDVNARRIITVYV